MKVVLLVIPIRPGADGTLDNINAQINVDLGFNDTEDVLELNDRSSTTDKLGVIDSNMISSSPDKCLNIV